MSWPVTLFYCTNCDFEQGDARAWGMKDYVLASGVRVRVSWHLGWCLDCDGLAAIEDLSLDKGMEELRKAQKALDEHLPLVQPVGWQSRILRKSSQAAMNEWERRHFYLSEAVDDAQDTLDMLKFRANPARCLSCGSTRVLTNLVSNRASWDMSQPKATGSTHPGCGGELWMKEGDLRIAMKPSISSYTPEGDFIDKVYVGGYSAPNDGYFEARDTQNAKARGKTIPPGQKIWVGDGGG